MTKYFLIACLMIPAFAQGSESVDYWRCLKQAPLLYPNDIKDIWFSLREALARASDHQVSAEKVQPTVLVLQVGGFDEKTAEALNDHLYLKGLRRLTPPQVQELVATADFLTVQQTYDLIAADELAVLCPAK